MAWTKRRFLAATLFSTTMGVALLVGACSSPPQSDSSESVEATKTDSPQAVNQEVNVYSARHYDSDDELYARFSEVTGIKVNVIEGKPDELIERIKSEGANSPADVFITVDAGNLWRAQEAGLFQPIDSSALKQAIPENLREPSGLWFGLTTRARLIVYNTGAVQPDALSTYEALAEPQWKGRVCIRSSGNIYNQSLVGSMLETNGVEKTTAWVKGLVANLARQPEGGDIDQIKAVSSGLCDVAIVNHYYWARLAKSSEAADQAAVANTALFFPNQGDSDRGTHVNIGGAGVLANAPHKEDAIAFLEFLVTPEAQKIFADGNNEYPVVQGVELDPIVAKLGQFKVDTVNVAAYGRNNPEVVKVVDQAGWK
jgi:iron(III) transport system substrate-binding protein